MNRLKDETSPYLLQHKDNPVDWYPWGDEAFHKAKAEDKPVLLSVGYSACHWCHVMAHESFEDDETARMMNDLFVNIKVDREERPDVDDIYMGAVQALTRRGGWPMTVFLLPDGRPFYGGTYFPKDARYAGMPTFKQVMSGVMDAYRNRREEVEKVADDLTGALKRDLLRIGGDIDALNAGLLNEALRRINQEFDRMHGGFNDAPKFPQPMNLEFLLRCYARTKDGSALHMVTHTLRKMAQGGIYDQIGGGFARYSVDAIWLVPHFEKMLYDNAQLSRVYLHAWQITGHDFYRQIAEEVYDYILREMTAPEGGFYSATDADSEGEEGKFFVWSIAELEDLLGDDAPIAIEYYGATRGGNFEGHNILYVPNEDSVAAQRLGLTVEELREKITAIKHKLYAARAQRIPPGLDDKILTSWNGLMLASLAEAARVLNRRDYETAAVRCGEFILDSLLVEDAGQMPRLLRTYKNGQSKLNGYLEDYANIIDAFLELYQTTWDERWFTTARALADRVLAHFAAPDGGFYDTSDDHEDLIVRPRNVQDNATPSGNGMMSKQLLRLAAYTGDGRYMDAARGTVRLLTEAMRQYPLAFGESLSATDMLVNGVAEVALVGDPKAPQIAPLLEEVRRPFRPNLIAALARENVPDEAVIPLLSYRTMRGGQPTVYVCREFTCKMPVTTAEETRALLDEMQG
ncbi:MAG: thioredoxin domain-containing protein [bacterium]|nr:thioredoxin domain-containing protein [bacterium]